MAIPTFVAHAPWGPGAGTGAVTPDMPTGATTGDILIMHIESEGEDANAEAGPTGGAWTLIASVASGTNGAPDKTRNTVYWANYDSGINRTVPDAGNHTFAKLSAWRGCDTTNPVHVIATNTSGTNNTSVSMTGPTTLVDDCLIVGFHTAGDNANISGWTNANLASPGITEAYDAYSTLGTDGHLSVFYGGLATAGAVGTTTATQTVSEEEANIVIALQPAATPVDSTIYYDSLADEADVSTTGGDGDGFDSGYTNNVTVKADDSVTIDYGDFTSRTNTMRMVASTPTPSFARTKDLTGSFKDLGFLIPIHFDNLPSTTGYCVRLEDTDGNLIAEIRITSAGVISLRDSTFTQQESDTGYTAGNTYWITGYIEIGSAGTYDIDIYDDAGTLQVAWGGTADFWVDQPTFGFATIGYGGISGWTWRVGQVWWYDGTASVPTMPTFSSVTPQAVAATSTITPALATLMTRYLDVDATTTATPVVSTLSTRYRTLTSTSTVGPALSQLGTWYRSLDSTSTVTPALTTASVFARALAVTSTVTSALSRVATYGKALAATSTVTPVLATVSTFYRTIAAATTATASLVRKMFVELAVTPLMTITQAAKQLLVQALDATTTVTAALDRVVTYGQTLATTSTITPVISRLNTFYRTLAVTPTITAALSQVRTFYRTLASTVTLTPAIAQVRTFYRTLAASSVVTAVVATPRIVVQTIAAAATHVAALATNKIPVGGGPAAKLFSRGVASVGRLLRGNDET